MIKSITRVSSIMVYVTTKCSYDEIFLDSIHIFRLNIFSRKEDIHMKIFTKTWLNPSHVDQKMTYWILLSLNLFYWALIAKVSIENTWNEFLENIVLRKWINFFHGYGEG